MLVPGRNCWRIERAHRLAFFVDAASYFAALRSAIAQAKHSVLILGWDFDSRIKLVPAGANDGFPEELGPFLREVVRRERGLHVYVLSWDFVMLFATNREWVPLYKLGWRTHPAPRLSFRLDDKHPLSGSHHQKVVVVDDAVAFVGGLDLTHGRWDTPDHLPTQRYRLDAHGMQSRPNHDVQSIVDGAAARALGELCRDRWYRATKRRTSSVDAASASDPWPHGVPAELTDIDVAIARTDPGYVTGQAVEEIRALYVDAIASAKHTLYLENQYFSSSVVGAALEKRLTEPDAPEVVVVSRLTEEGWLEERTMGLLRARLHQRLREADKHDRYRLFYPHVPNLLAPNLLNVHSKVLVVDDELCSVGSANFNNRSMGFDTECNIAIEANGDERTRRVIASLRDRLLAEHLGTERTTVACEIARHGGSVVKAVEALRHPGRSLEPIDPQVNEDVERLLPASALVDPERPVDIERLMMERIPPRERRSFAGRVARVAASLVMLAAVIALWRWTPLHDWIPLHALLDLARGTTYSPWAPFAALGIYAGCGLLGLPITIVVAITGLVFGPWLGGLVAIAGMIAHAAVAYGVGRVLGRDAVRRIAGSRLNRITLRLSRHGTLAIAALRLFPIASFYKVSIVAGASHVHATDFVLGTAIGMAPVVAVILAFVGALEAAISNPNVFTYGALVAVSSVVTAAALFVWRRFGRLDSGPRM
jgi:phosphatidylserine/phosphatidylglycerophosphate/cardiolipin synthase-like enzyme/uncharacterized membrane protein YdjX (TVP38/TMEM64 family)